jgi:ATP synthase protein I
MGRMIAAKGKAEARGRPPRAGAGTPALPSGNTARRRRMPGFLVYSKGFADLIHRVALCALGCFVVQPMAIRQTTPRPDRSPAWNEPEDEAASAHPKPLTREEAAALRASQPSLSPWRVVAGQAGVGAVVALLAVLITGRQEMAWSVLYGAATVVVPGALMARGMTSTLTSMSPGSSAVSFMLWEAVKIAVSIAMLMLAPKLVQPLSWPALLVGLVLCMKVYWVALVWRAPVSRISS